MTLLSQNGHLMYQSLERREEFLIAVQAQQDACLHIEL